MPVIGYRFGQVTYQHAALARMVHPVGAPAITINGNPSTHISLINTDILRKRPVHPFIYQDEWRIAIYTDGYANLYGYEYANNYPYQYRYRDGD